jgi:hypothetical protein
MGYAKVWKEKKYGHMKVQEEKEKINKYMWTHEGPTIYMEKMMSTWRLLQNDSHVLRI